MNPVPSPRLSIGLPVYNGERYLDTAIRSVLAQTFTDFEFIIVDNASTDATGRIALGHAKRDSRVRYHRNDSNIGATQNWYRVLQLAAGEYFASVAHDDVYEPDYMRACIEILDRDVSVGVCHTKTCTIDEQGKRGPVIASAVDTTSSSAHRRLYEVIRHDYLCIQLYGVMRTELIRRTTVFEGYYGCDRNTLAELCLLGRIVEFPECLFNHRLYPEALGAIVSSGKSRQEMSSVDPGTDWHLKKPERRIWRNYFRSVSRLVQSPVERMQCYLALTILLARRFAGRCRRAVPFHRS
jgi:glycosyltransferase involved in cell wall biosynthesis